jgi:hypothetical protein
MVAASDSARPEIEDSDIGDLLGLAAINTGTPLWANGCPKYRDVLWRYKPALH